MTSQEGFDPLLHRLFEFDVAFHMAALNYKKAGEDYESLIYNGAPEEVLYTSLDNMRSKKRLMTEAWNVWNYWKDLVNLLYN